jgi:predicted component of type VI protein secretion system
MRPEVVLTFQNGGRAGSEVAVEARRFTIGRDADNDLVVDDARVAHRHAVIENFDGGVLIYDCQTERGTRLNNMLLGTRGGTLRDGDLITLGGACDLIVTLRASDADARTTAGARTAAGKQTSVGTRAVPRISRALAREPSDTTMPKPYASTSVTARVFVAAGVALVFVTIALFMLARQREATGNTNGDAGRLVPTANVPAANVEGGGGVVVERERPQPDAGTTSKVDAAAISDEEIEQAATRAVQRASGDDRSYSVPHEALADIRQQVEAYRQSAALRADMAAMRRDAREVAAEARSAGMEPQFLTYAALALGGDGGAVARARALAPQLQQLRTTFGDDADSTLIVIAAYTSGVGSRQSHPLLKTIRLLKPNPFTERNVWYLHARGGLSDAAYRFVIRFIAAGIVAHDPARYGLPSERLNY